MVDTIVDLFQRFVSHVRGAETKLKLESVQLRKHCISKAERHRARRSGFSGLFGLKILFSDVLRSPRGNGHVEPRGRGPGVWARRGPGVLVIALTR